MVKQFSLIEKELADGAKITEYNLHAKSDKYTVRIEKNSEKKTFPNISHAHLESLLKSQGHSFSPSLDLSTAINKDNYSITEYHLDSISNHFVVTVSKQLDSGIIDSISFPMITTAELAPLLQIPEEMVSNTVTLHLSFEQALSHGYNIEEYHSHQNNENYTVHLKKGNAEKTFTNISPQKLLSVVNPPDNILPPTWNKTPDSQTTPTKATEPIKRSSSKKRKSFQSYVDSGGKVTSIHKNEKGSFSIKIELPDGTVHPFASVSEEKLKNVDGFQECLQESATLESTAMET